MESKSPILSKTLWSALIVAASAFVPSVHDFIVSQPESYAVVLGILFGALRLISKGKIAVS
jgi:hypothetical protein